MDGRWKVSQHSCHSCHPQKKLDTQNTPQLLFLHPSDLITLFPEFLLLLVRKISLKKPRQNQKKHANYLAFFYRRNTQPQQCHHLHFPRFVFQEDYVFGFDDVWILAPQRDGPHNWEDVGIRSILRAIEILAQQVRLETAHGATIGADASRSSVCAVFLTTKRGWGEVWWHEDSRGNLTRKFVLKNGKILEECQFKSHVRRKTGNFLLGFSVFLDFFVLTTPKKWWLPKMSASIFKLRGVLGPLQRQGLVVFPGKSQAHEVHPGKWTAGTRKWRLRDFLHPDGIRTCQLSKITPPETNMTIENPAFDDFPIQLGDFGVPVAHFQECDRKPIFAQSTPPKANS